MIIVTGGAGFIGSCLFKRLNDLKRNDLLIVDEDGEKSPKSFNLESKKALDYFERGEFIDLLEKGRFDGKVDVIFHMGACSSTLEMNQAYLAEVNSEYSMRLAKWSISQGVRFLYASSAATYGDGELGYSDDPGLLPNLKPLNPYGQSKQDFDLWVLKQKVDKKLTGFKFFNVYGPNEYHKADMRSMVHKGFYQIKKEGKIRLFKSYHPDYPDGGQMRDFVYVMDVIDALIWFWKNPGPCGIYNIGSGKAESWNDLAEALFLAMGIEKNIEYFEMPEKLQKQYQYWTQADLQRLRQAGYAAPFRPLREGVQDYVKNYLQKSDPYY